MDTISINEFLANIPENELLIIEQENPPVDIIFMSFVENPKLNAVKYTMKSKNIFINKVSYFEFPRYYADIITNIRCCNDTILLLNNKPIKCNISNLTLPIINMKYISSKLEIASDGDIVYDAYLLSDELRNQLIKKRIISDDIMFFAGGIYYRINST